MHVFITRGISKYICDYKPWNLDLSKLLESLRRPPEKHDPLPYLDSEQTEKQKQENMEI